MGSLRGIGKSVFSLSVNSPKHILDKRLSRKLFFWFRSTRLCLSRWHEPKDKSQSANVWLVSHQITDSSALMLVFGALHLAWKEIIAKDEKSLVWVTSSSKRKSDGNSQIHGEGAIIHCCNFDSLLQLQKHARERLCLAYTYDKLLASLKNELCNIKRRPSRIKENFRCAPEVCWFRRILILIPLYFVFCLALHLKWSWSKTSGNLLSNLFAI